MSKNRKDQETAALERLFPRDVADAVTSRVTKLAGSGELHLPENYSAPNALKAAFLAMQTSESADKLMKCDEKSIADALLDMVIQGLNPALDQCYFAPFAGKCVLMVSYIGKVAILRRVYGSQARVWPVVVYVGDDVSKAYTRGRLVIEKHTIGPNDGDQKKISAAYCVVELGKEEEPYTEWMSFDQIETAWKQAPKGKTPAHNKFPSEMAKKTVIARAVKLLTKSSDDSHLVAAMERQELAAAETYIEAELLEEANTELLEVKGRADVAEGDPVERLEDAVDRARDRVTVTDADGEKRPAGDGGDEADQGPAEDSPSSPAARFADLCEECEIDPTKARQVVAQLNRLDDSRKITHAMFDEVLGDVDEFLALYTAKTEKGPDF